MYARDFREIANQKMTGKWGEAAVVYLIYGAIIGAISGSTAGIATIILTGPLYLGFVMFIIAISKGEKAEISTLFDGFKHFGNAMILGILHMLYLILWTMLFIIPGIIKRYSYAMCYFILSENPDISPNEAITQSRKIMDGHKWRLFCLHFSYIGWVLLSMLTFGILLLWVVPKMELAQYEFYLDLKNRQA
jgi:uncharacterized membrane protein